MQRMSFDSLYFESKALTTLINIFWTLNTLRESSLILLLIQTFHSIFVDPWIFNQRDGQRCQKKQRYFKSSNTINYIFCLFTDEKLPIIDVVNGFQFE